MNFNLMRFKTLLLREWLQNRWTWAVVVSALPLLMLVTMPFGDVSLPDKTPVQLVAGVVIALSGMVAVLAAWGTVLFMAPGLARRDSQDRSIEFWLSLPSTHREHVGAQYVSHALMFPLGALVAGVGFGLVLMPIILIKWQGMAALAAVNWPALVAWLGTVAALVVFSLVLAALWLSPLVMVLMATSAWVKRLALPLLALGATALANLPATAPVFRGAMVSYGKTVGVLLDGPVRVFASGAAGALQEMELRPQTAQSFVQQALTDLATPQFALAMAVALLAAYVLVLRRQRG
jgi:ABC-2 type transport system permease protein